MAPGAVLEVDLPEPVAGPSPEPAVDVSVLHADDAVIVVDKPAGLVVHPGAGHATGTLVNALLARFPDMIGRAWPDPARPGVVHRLDKGTSGVLMVARTPEAADLVVRAAAGPQRRAALPGPRLGHGRRHAAA